MCHPMRYARPRTTSSTCCGRPTHSSRTRSEEHTSELQSPCNLVCRLLLEKKNRRCYTQSHRPKKTRDRALTVNRQGRLTLSRQPRVYSRIVHLNLVTTMRQPPPSAQHTGS